MKKPFEYTTPIFPMPITTQEIKKIAQLARINLTPDEEVRYASTISTVLEYMTMLNEVDTSAVVPTSQVTGLVNVVRADEVIASPHREALVAALPSREEDELSVPGVFEQSSDE